MDEIKPVAWAFAQDWTKFQADRRECRLLPNFYYGEDMSLSSGFAALYDQQAIDTLRAEIERQKELISDLNSIIRGIPAELRRASQAKQELSDFLIARAERAEAEADALRKDAERYRWLRQNEDWTLDGIVRWQEGYEPINASHEVLDAAIDIARQEKQ